MNTTFMQPPQAPLKLKRIPLVNKREWVLRKVAGKSVLHAGPTDHPMTEGKARRGELLHLDLQKACAEVVGIDLAEESILWLKRNCGVNDIICGNIEALKQFFPSRKFDVVFAGDVIEHINNIGLFFQGAHEVLAADGELIITVPSAFSLKKLLGVLLWRQERNHPDHLYYFTPLSLQQAAFRFGYEITEMATFMGESPERRENRWANAIVKGIIWLTGNAAVADEIAIVMRARSNL